MTNSSDDLREFPAEPEESSLKEQGDALLDKQPKDGAGTHQDREEKPSR